MEHGVWNISGRAVNISVLSSLKPGASVQGSSGSRAAVRERGGYRGSEEHRGVFLSMPENFDRSPAQHRWYDR
jgi:hypothetical protein